MSDFELKMLLIATGLLTTCIYLIYEEKFR